LLRSQFVSGIRRVPTSNVYRTLKYHSGNFAELASALGRQITGDQERRD
jgi:hypothetical protein